MNKIEIKERIESLPLFEKRKILVSNSVEGDCQETTEQEGAAICEVGGTKSYAYVGKGYNLIQFKDVFNPVVDSFEEDIEGYLSIFGGFCMLKIFPQIDYLKDDTGEFGLIAMNSVNLSSSIMVKFCVKHNERHFTIPSRIAGLRQQHTGKAVNVTKNYMSMISKVKHAWKTIIENFPKYKIVLDVTKSDEEKILGLGNIVDKLELGKRLSQKIKDDYEIYTCNGKFYTLWDLFLKVIDEVSGKEYKSETHKQRKIDTICQSIFEYSMLLNL